MKIELIEAYVTNLKKYAEGELVGALLSFPTTPEAIQDRLKQIGVDRVRYEKPKQERREFTARNKSGLLTLEEQGCRKESL